MKITALLPLTAALIFPALLPAQDAPVQPQKTWEIHVRTDGGGNPRLAEITRQLLSPISRTVTLGENASFHAIGLRNPATRGGDWIVEIRGANDARTLVEDAAKYGDFRFENGTLLLSRDQHTYAIWASADNVIRAAHPAENRSSGIVAGDDVPGPAWVSGGIPISSIKEELPKSDILRLLDRIDFSIKSNGAEITADVLTASITPEMAEKAAAKVRQLSAAATLISGEDVSLEDLAKDLTITQTEDKLRIHFNISESTLEKGLMGIHQLLKITRGK